MSVLNCANQRAQIFYASSACLINSEEKLRRFSVRYDENKMEGIHMNYIKSKAAALKEILSREDLRYRLTVLYPCVVLGPRKNGAARLFEEVPALCCLPCLSVLHRLSFPARLSSQDSLLPRTSSMLAMQQPLSPISLTDRSSGDAIRACSTRRSDKFSLLVAADNFAGYRRSISIPTDRQGQITLLSCEIQCRSFQKSRSKRNSLCTRHLILAQVDFAKFSSLPAVTCCLISRLSPPCG